MKNRVPVLASADIAYPTLQDFAHDRRGFLRRLALGTLAVGFGSVACYDEQSIERRSAAAADAADATGAEPDATDEVRLDTTAAPDNTVRPDTFTTEEEELPWAGGMMEPEFYQVRLPEAGSSQVYLAQEGYLSFAVAVLTYDFSVAEALRQAPGDALQAVATALSAFTCEDTAQPVSAALTAALRQALQDVVVAELGYGYVESAELLVDYCDTLMLIDGDMAEPQYP